MPRTTCSVCAGQGYYQVAVTRRCSSCNGTGRNINPIINQICTKCNGCGIEPCIENRICPHCDGTGYSNY